MHLRFSCCTLFGNQDFRGVILSFRHVQEYRVYELCRNGLLLFDCNCDRKLKIDVAPVCNWCYINCADVAPIYATKDELLECGLHFLLPLLSLP